MVHLLVKDFKYSSRDTDRTSLCLLLLRPYVKPSCTDIAFCCTAVAVNADDVAREILLL